MKKRSLALLVVMVLVAAAVIVAVPRASASDHENHCLCAGDAAGLGGHSCEDATWTAWDATANANFKTTLPASGNYYLTENVALTAVHQFTGDANICLNGFTVSGPTSGGVLKVAGNVKLGFCDCSEKKDGKVIARNTNGKAADWRGQVFELSADGFELNLYSGTFTMATGAQYGNAGMISNGTTGSSGATGTINLYNAVLTNGKASYGGSITLRGGANEQPVVNIYGGRIEGGYGVTYGGNILVMTQATINMYGGVIADGYVEVENTSANGGNLMFNNGAATFNLYGGLITGGNCFNRGGNAYVGAGTINMTGGAITGGVVRGNSGVGGNVELGGSSTVGTLNMSGGIITGGNVAGTNAAGGGVAPYYSDSKGCGGVVNVSGTAKIYGNYTRKGTANETASDIYVYSGSWAGTTRPQNYVFVGTAIDGVNKTALESGAMVCITMANTAVGTAATQNGTADDAKYIFATGADYVIGFDTDKMAVVNAVDGFSDLQAALDAGETNIVLNGNSTAVVQLVEDVTISNGDYAVKVDLNGKNAVVTGTGKVTAIDSVATYTAGGGTVQASNLDLTAQENGKRYVAVGVENGYTIRRFYVGITDSWLHASVEGMSFRVATRGADVTEYGVYLSIQGVDGEYKYTLTDGATIVLLKNFLQTNLQDADVTVQAYVKVNGMEVRSVVYTLNFGEMLAAA